jgi:hypothetical protein
VLAPNLSMVMLGGTQTNRLFPLHVLKRCSLPQLRLLATLWKVYGSRGVGQEDIDLFDASVYLQQLEKVPHNLYIIYSIYIYT